MCYSIRILNMIVTKTMKIVYCLSHASKHINDLLNGEQLDDSNYYIWFQKIQYLLNAYDALVAITKIKETSAESAFDENKEQY